MPFEAFLSYLKQLCEASNYKTVAFTVARKWAQARAFTFTKGDISSPLDLEISPSSDFLHTTELTAAVSTSALLLALARTQDHVNLSGARYLSCIMRDRVEVRCGEWLLLACAGQRVIACVQELAEVVLPRGSYIRMWCTHRQSTGVTEGADAMMRLSKKDACSAGCTLLVRLEQVSITQLLCEDRGDHLEFRYLL